MQELSTNVEHIWEVAKVIFPYPQIKAPQRKIIQSIISSSHPILISSQIGVGKTAAVLTGLLALKKQDEKIIIFVRTKAQINVFLRELSLIHRKTLKNWKTLQLNFQNFPVFLPFLGKNELCLKAKENFPSEIYTHICNLTKCPLKAKTQNVSQEDIINSVRNLFNSFSDIISKEDIIDSLESKKYCPYFYSYYLMQKADVIITSYPFLENNVLFSRLLYSMRIATNKLLIAIDEAHNLYKPVNQDISKNQLEKAYEEFPHHLFSVLLELTTKKQTTTLNIEEEEFKDLEEGLFNLLQSQLYYNQQPALNAYLVYHFLMIAKGNLLVTDYQKLSIINVKPSEVLTKFTDSKRLVLFSGSFEPLRSFQRIFSIPNSRILRVFPPKEEIEAKYFVVCNQKLNAKYENRDEEYYILIASSIRNICDVIPGHTLVFVPSYNYIQKLLARGIIEPDIVETPELDITTLTAILTSSKEKKIILCVTGGKISEGVEFSIHNKSIIKGVIFTALPFPPPSEESKLIHKDLSAQFGKQIADEFTIIIPMIQRLAQGFGRAIRNKGDKAVHILLDPRGTRYSQEFKFERHASLKTLKRAIVQFFAKENLNRTSI
ncbi:MAG: helicase C-terminal domain-containing protein [Candidatus Heimdallarchaeaceae archaeon]